MNARPEVLSFFHATTSTWTHIIIDPATRAAVIVDPVLDFDAGSTLVSTQAAEHVLAEIRRRDLQVEWILETHTHADHLSAADWLKRALSGTGAAPRTAIGAGVVDVQRHFKQFFGLGSDFADDGSQFDRLLRDGEQFRLGKLDVQVIATPGHTRDGISYRVDDAVFVGDTLLAPEAGTGRCDFPGGDAAAQYRSIQRLYRLPDATRVFLCHDYPSGATQPRAQSTVAAQKVDNIQLKADTSEADYILLRARRDSTLPPPRLLYPSLQVNIRAGQLPPADAAGQIFVRTPDRADF